MSCDPAIKFFFPRDMDFDGTIAASTPFRIVVENKGDFGDINVDFDAQPALTTGGPATWRLVGSTRFSSVNKGETRTDEPQLKIDENDAVIRAATRGDPAGAPSADAIRVINVVVV
jgi:hypothetical protein